jgi:hypothetical protein
VMTLSLPVPAEVVEAIAQRAAELVLRRYAEPNSISERRWLYGARAAAEYLDWPVGRVQKLTAANSIPYHRLDGEQRVSYRTDELDGWLDGFYEGPPRTVQSAF